jgi:hypothetical protein
VTKHSYNYKGYSAVWSNGIISLSRIPVKTLEGIEKEYLLFLTSWQDMIKLKTDIQIALNLKMIVIKVNLLYLSWKLCALRRLNFKALIFHKI